MAVTRESLICVPKFRIDSNMILHDNKDALQLVLGINGPV